MPFGEFGYPRWEKIRLQNSQCYNWTLLLGNRWKTRWLGGSLLALRQGFVLLAVGRDVR